MERRNEQRKPRHEKGERIMANWQTEEKRRIEFAVHGDDTVELRTVVRPEIARALAQELLRWAAFASERPSEPLRLPSE
jgi:hypothetical protein